MALFEGCKTFCYQDVSVHFSFSKFFFWYAVDINLFRLESTNPKINSQTLDTFQMSEWSICLVTNRLFVWSKNLFGVFVLKHPGGLFE